MSAPDYMFVNLDDWEVLYCNGEVVLEGHRLEVKDVLNEMEIPCDFKYASLDYLNGNRAVVPRSPSDFPEGAFE